MKKVMTLVMVMVLALSFAGCGQKTETEPETKQETKVEEKTQTEIEARSATAVLDAITLDIKQANYARAKSELDEAIKLYPTSPELYSAYADYYIAQNQKDAALLIIDEGVKQCGEVDILKEKAEEINSTEEVPVSETPPKTDTASSSSSSPSSNSNSSGSSSNSGTSSSGSSGSSSNSSQSSSSSNNQPDSSNSGSSVAKEETAEIEIVKAPGSVSPGEEATVKIKGKANTSYSISVVYKSGASKSSDLNSKVSDGNGYVSWTWKVGARTAAGTYNVTISGGGSTVRTTLTVS